MVELSRVQLTGSTCSMLVPHADSALLNTKCLEASAHKNAFLYDYEQHLSASRIYIVDIVD